MLKNPYQFIAFIVGIILSIIGLISAIVTIVTAPDPNLRSVATIVLMVIVSITLLIVCCISAYSIFKNMITVIGYVTPPRYGVREAQVSDLVEIAKLQKAFYPTDAVPLKVYKEWYSVNPEGFFVIEATITRDDGSEYREIVGHFTFLAIKDECLESFKRGEILETTITQKDLLSSSEKSIIKNLYIESVIVKRAHRRQGVFCLIRMLKTMICNFCDPKIAEKVYAMAATGDGEKALKGMGFSMVRHHMRLPREDGHEMYECDFKNFMEVVIDRETKHEINLLHRDR
jgi:hypothetical protein